jgi:hypothetical protein
MIRASKIFILVLTVQSEVPMSSKRAEILKQLLPHIATDNYDRYDGYVIFGASSVFDMIDDLAARPCEREDESLVRAVHELISHLRLHEGRSRVARRVSLDSPPQLKTDALSEESNALWEILAKKKHESVGDVRQPPASPESTVEDAIDAALADELLGKLPKMVDRTLRLDEINVRDVDNQDVKRYFYEALRCYLYGFPIACAVLCRAILASALENVCDPKGIVRKAVAPGDSYFGALIEKAKRDKLLTDDRPDCAIKVRDAGNEAIHDFQKFQRRWSNRLDEIVIDTRKVLLDLYAQMRT